MARQALNEAFARTSFLSGTNAAYIDELFQRFQENPGSVDESWRAFFASMQDVAPLPNGDGHGPSWTPERLPFSGDRELTAAFDGDWDAIEQQMQGRLQQAVQSVGGNLSAAATLRATQDSVRALMMIRAYRVRGHLASNLDPLGLAKRSDHHELMPESYGFTAADLDRPIFLDKVLGLETGTVRQILEILQRTYCGTIGVEFMHISDPTQKAWIQQRIEGEDKGISFTREGKRAILNKIIEAETFEGFLDVKYTGTKRFGLDGGESMVPALEQITKRGGQLGLREIVVGMPHRGRLNVRCNVMGKPHRALFHEFHGGSANPEDVEGSGDVKYHLGASSDREFDGNKVHLSLTANPSHLEIVDPVVLGKVRAKQDQLNDAARVRVLPLLLHGDAAFAGQGVVAECFGLSGLRGHRTGGSIHFIVNNQIGFTTSPHHSRSSPYPSDVARMIEAPIFHANGDDPEAVTYVAKVATEFRQRFGKPVVIDMFCYRRLGHNEGDEPSFTQPLMYKRIRQHPKVSDIYARRLIEEGTVEEQEVDAMRASFRAHLEGEFAASDSYRPNKADWLDGRWSAIGFAEEGARRGTTGVEPEVLKEVGRRLTTLPKDLEAHKTILRLVERRRQMVEGEVPVDWAMAEHLAFGTLLKEGFPVRLSGQDSERGTFSQRHAVITDQNDEHTYTPLKNVSADQARFEVINSMLSEEAVLGFEYGYSVSEPMALVLWEAQFGDFANGAQVVIDQFISSGESKWLRMSGLVLLLPHGYEGQGPEHSSARLERYLQLSAEDNWQIANCTTPANYFHILRRQLHRRFRKPLVLMTPKSLLRHKRVISSLTEFAPGTSFHRVLWDDAQSAPGSTLELKDDTRIRRVVMCSGKVYYDLLERREELGIDDVYLLRLEQLYPFPARALMDELMRFKDAEMIWCQEEPKNMGAWTSVEPNIEWVLQHIDAKFARPRYVGRAALASTATGLFAKHQKEQSALVEDALGVD
ncbi:MAG: 2-oxoglutarate dehydrogenase E1 component [Rhizobiales bacterium]|nr:2-oxoglutarate dehydrogenase E1 component [Hyphomicrobiales bacterium]